MRPCTGETTFVLSATKGNLHSEMIAAYRRNIDWAKKNPSSWAFEFFHEQLYWSWQPTLICSWLGLCSRQGLFRRAEYPHDSGAQWATFTTADGKVVRSVETTAMYDDWRVLVNAGNLASAQKFVEEFVALECLALYHEAVREDSEGGEPADCKRRKTRA